MNVYYVAGIPYSDELYHHGIKGQKWGIRRYQNPDGTYTEQGLRRYGAKSNSDAEKLAKYQESEISRTKKQNEVADKYYENKLSKLNRKLEDANLKGKTKKAEKINKRIEFEKDRQKYDKEITKQIVKDIENMSVKDMKKEKVKAGAATAAAVILTVGSFSYASAYGGVGLFLPMSPSYYTDTKRVKKASLYIANSKSGN